MKKAKRTFVSLVTFLFLTATAIWLWAGGGLKLGSRTLGVASAPSLSMPGPLRMHSARFVGSVGGVAFGQAASPGASLQVTSLDLSYDGKKADCDRLILKINGTGVSAPLCDWQMLPIARFANGSQASLVTAFGQLTGSTSANTVTKGGGRIINYHSDVSNTLLGLRLMQADLLLVEPDAVDLPKMNEAYLLGAGEQAPNLTANKAAWGTYSKNAASAQATHGKYRSYVLGDEGVAVTFNVVSGALAISGDPKYLFWRYRVDAANYNATTEKKAAVVREQARYAQAKKQAGFDAKSWLVSRVLEIVDDLPATAAKSPISRATLQKLSVDELEQLLDVAAEASAPFVVEKLPQYDAVLWNKLTAREINPQVYDAARQTMRYAAFFRYVRDKHASTWKTFLAQTQGKKATPAVQTPTTMQ